MAQRTLILEVNPSFTGIYSLSGIYEPQCIDGLPISGPKAILHLRL